MGVAFINTWIEVAISKRLALAGMERLLRTVSPMVVCLSGTQPRTEMRLLFVQRSAVRRTGASTHLT